MLYSFTLLWTMRTSSAMSISPSLEVSIITASPTLWLQLTLHPYHSGSDNIAVMTTLALYFLLAHPDYYQRLREELDAAFPDPTGSLPANDLAALSLLNGVINEALRLGTPFFLPRIVPKGGALLDNRFIPEDTIVALAAYSQQLSADNFFPEPAVGGVLILLICRPTLIWALYCRSSIPPDGCQTASGLTRRPTRPSWPPSRSVRSVPCTLCLSCSLQRFNL